MPVNSYPNEVLSKIAGYVVAGQFNESEIRSEINLVGFGVTDPNVAISCYNYCLRFLASADRKFRHTC
jgi:hypothetical protein